MAYSTFVYMRNGVPQRDPQTALRVQTHELKRSSPQGPGSRLIDASITPEQNCAARSRLLGVGSRFRMCVVFAFNLRGVGDYAASH